MKTITITQKERTIFKKDFLIKFANSRIQKNNVYIISRSTHFTKKEVLFIRENYLQFFGVKTESQKYHIEELLMNPKNFTSLLQRMFADEIIS